MAYLRREQLLILALCGLLLLVACGSPAAPTGGAAASLAGTQWVLTGYGPASQPVALPDGAQVTAEFTSDQVKGAAPCNSYGGGYSVDGKRLTVGQLVQTERACLREDLMALESTFLKALSAATSYTIDGDTLTIDYDGGVLCFARSAPPVSGSGGS